MHDTRRGDLHQQQIELLEGLGQARQPAVSDPAILWSDTDFGVDAPVIGGDERPDRLVELTQRQRRRGNRLAAHEAAGQLCQQSGVDAAEEPLDLPASLGPRHGGVHDVELQVGGDLSEVVADEVAAVIDVEDLGNPAHRPRGIGLGPDRLAQRQGCVQRRGRAQVDGVAGHCPRAVVEDHRQPGPLRRPAVVDEDVELGVVDLPHRVRVVGAAAVDQFEGVAEGGGAVVCQGGHRRVDRGDDRPNSVVGHRIPSLIGGDACGAAGDRRQRRARSAQGHALDQPHQLRVGSPAGRPSPGRGKPGQAGSSVALQPPLRGAGWHARLSRRAEQWNPVLDMRPQDLEAAHRLLTS